MTLLALLLASSAWAGSIFPPSDFRKTGGTIEQSVTMGSLVMQPVSGLSGRLQARSVGSASNDVTQDAVTIKPNAALSAFWRPFGIYLTSAAATPFLSMSSAGVLNWTGTGILNTTSSFSLVAAGDIGLTPGVGSAVTVSGLLSTSGESGVAIRPDADNTLDVGTSSFRYRTGYFGTSLIIGSGPTISKAATSGALKSRNATTTFADLNLNVLAADPGTLENGDFWLFDNGVLRAIRFRAGGVTYSATAL